MKLSFSKALAALMLLLCVFAGCSELSRVMNMRNCQYSYKSIQNVTLSGIKVTNGSAMDKIRLGALFLTSQPETMPLRFTLNINVTNPNTAEAGFSGMDYDINIDNIDITAGSITEPFSVSAGETNTLPIAMECDMATLLTGDTKDAAVKMLKNFVGLSKEASNVNVKLRPIFLIGGSSVKSPTSFPVNFTFGGSSK